MPLIETPLGSLFVDDRGEDGEPAALLWPSLFTDHSMWDGQIGPLRRAGFRTLAIDPPGHGASGWPGRRFTMDECADAALRVLDAVGVRSPVMVLGTSWGGFVAPRIAIRAPDRVRAMVLFSTSADAPLRIERAKSALMTNLMRLERLDRLTERIRSSSLLSRRTRAARPWIAEQLAARYRTWTRPALLDAARSVLLDREPFLAHLHGVACPTLVVSGEDDAILPPALGRRNASANPNARYAAVAHAAHLIPLEEPERANALVATFLNHIRQSGNGYLPTVSVTDADDGPRQPSGPERRREPG